ncbi:MAG: IS1595 family transposase [Candidatus Kerfeldbacteria bacterium]|nr:IS1595 family transposase [Candidatus Kerfeldbacteria bacterium]
MIALLHQIPSEATIRKELRKIIFGRNVFCPFCRSRHVHRSEARYWCTRCRTHFSLLSGTWLANLKLSLRTFWALLWCWTQKVPVQQTQKLCHVSEVSVAHWFRQFRLHLPDFDPILNGVIQMDEAYFSSLSLVMAKQIGSKCLAHVVLPKPSVDKRDATEFLFQHVEPQSNLQTDGAGIYKAIERWWPVRHTVDIHRKFQFGRTSEIEGMFGVLRTFIRRMYHHTTPEYLPEYVSEFCIRFSSPEIFESPSQYLSKTLMPVPTC